MLKNNARYASIVRSVCWSARLVNRREINSSFYPGYEEKRSESSAIIDLSDFVRFDVWAVWNRPPWKNENHERLNVPRLTEFLVSSVNRGCDYFVRWRKERKKKKREIYAILSNLFYQTENLFTVLFDKPFDVWRRQ